jgi:ATP-dependent Lon protease
MATSNNISKVMLPLQSRFFVVNLESYTYEQFYQITVELLNKRLKDGVVYPKGRKAITI